MFQMHCLCALLSRSRFDLTSLLAVASVATLGLVPRTSRAQDLYVSNFSGGSLSRISSGGGVASDFVTSGVGSPTGLAFAANGDLYVADYSGGSLFRIAAGTNIPTAFITAGFSNPNAIVFDASGTLYVANSGDNTVSRVLAGTNTVTGFITSGLSGPTGLAFDSAGNLFISNYYAGTISEEVAADVAAGNDNALTVFDGLATPFGLAADTQGNVYVATGDAVSQFSSGQANPNFTISGFAQPYGLALDAGGNLYVADAMTSTVSQVAVGMTTAATYATGLTNPTYLAFGPTVAATAPEPGTLALLGFGVLPLAGAVARRRRR